MIHAAKAVGGVDSTAHAAADEYHEGVGLPFHGNSPVNCAYLSWTTKSTASLSPGALMISIKRLAYST
jgi:hypothetical protein